LVSKLLSYTLELIARSKGSGSEGLDIAHRQIHVASSKQRVARRRKTPIREIKTVVRAILEEQGEESIDILRRPAMDDVEIKRDNRGAQ
jgi:hypothetical protein